jgi:hypothetical protein
MSSTTTYTNQSQMQQQPNTTKLSSASVYGNGGNTQRQINSPNSQKQQTYQQQQQQQPSYQFPNPQMSYQHAQQYQQQNMQQSPQQFQQQMNYKNVQQSQQPMQMPQHQMFNQFQPQPQQQPQMQQSPQMFNPMGGPEPNPYLSQQIQYQQYLETQKMQKRANEQQQMRSSMIPQTSEYGRGPVVSPPPPTQPQEKEIKHVNLVNQSIDSSNYIVWNKPEPTIPWLSFNQDNLAQVVLEPGIYHVTADFVLKPEMENVTLFVGSLNGKIDFVSTHSNWISFTKRITSEDILVTTVQNGNGCVVNVSLYKLDD